MMLRPLTLSKSQSILAWNAGINSGMVSGCVHSRREWEGGFSSVEASEVDRRAGEAETPRAQARRPEKMAEKRIFEGTEVEGRSKDGLVLGWLEMSCLRMMAMTKWEQEGRPWWPLYLFSHVLSRLLVKVEADQTPGS